MKAANKGAKAPAELPEGRASTKGNSQDQSTYRTQGRGSVSQAVERIRQAATRKPQEKLTALLHHITTDALRCAFYDLKKTASAGVDGLVWTRYEDGLEERLLDLHGRVHSGAYRALPSRRVEIPKPDGGTRPLGIAALEDKIVQKAVVDDILTPLYEPEFLGFSYGFRPGRGAHDALDALAFGIERRKVNWIIDADIRAFFDRLSRDHLLRFLGHRIGDQRVLRLIAKWLNAGVMEGDEWKDDLQGTPQGAVVSPILANVYLHYVLDLWFQKKWRARKATGDTIIVRYADDFVVGCQRKADAEQFLDDLRERMNQFVLELHPDKTRLVEFGRFAMADRRARGERRPETFYFLGFTHYCKKKRNGNFGLGRKPIAKRGHANLATGQGETPRADARGCPRHGAMAGASGQRMVELLCRADQRPGSSRFREASFVDLAQNLARAVTEGSDHDSRGRTPRGPVLASRQGPAPLANRAICRQPPKVGAVCASAHVRI